MSLAIQLQQCKEELGRIKALTVSPSEFSGKFQERFHRLPTHTEMGRSLLKIQAVQELNYNDKISIIQGFRQLKGRNPSAEELKEMLKGVKMRRKESELQARLFSLSMPDVPSVPPKDPNARGRRLTKRRRRKSKKKKKKKKSKTKKRKKKRRRRLKRR